MMQFNVEGGDDAVSDEASAGAWANRRIIHLSLRQTTRLKKGQSIQVMTERQWFVIHPYAVPSEIAKYSREELRASAKMLPRK